MTAGKSWKRVRVVDDPLTWYQRQQLRSHVESQAVGEQVLVAHRADVPDHGPDVWLFDADSSTASALLMSYDAEGHWLGFEHITDPAPLVDIAARVLRVEEHAVPLNVYLTSVGSA